MDEQSIQNEVILDVDTHVVAVTSHAGKLLGTLATPTNANGYLALLTWVRSLGCIRRAGVEGTGMYGTGLVRVLREQGVEVLEVNRPNHAKRRLRGKSNPTDAENVTTHACLRGASYGGRSIRKRNSTLFEALYYS